MIRFTTILLIVGSSLMTGGCAGLRTTDPPRTATEQFLLSVAAQRAVEQLSVEGLRGKQVYVEERFVLGEPRVRPEANSEVIRPELQQEFTYLIAEVRAKLLTGGAFITDAREQARVIVEVRTRGIGIDRQDFFIGLPGTVLRELSEDFPDVDFSIAFWRTLKQYGFASVSMVAYWRDTGEVITTSGPFVGKTTREDTWIFGLGPSTVSDIPPAQQLQD